MSQKFRFSLQSVLEHRQHLQEQAQIALSKELAVQHQLESELQALQKEYGELEKARPAQGSGECIMRTIAYLDFMKGVIVRKAKEIEQAKGKVVEARNALVERNRAARALEILRERQHESFRKQANRQETRQLDDFGSQQFLRIQAT
ncbi:MAG TPA: flagellar export protein FliJ [Fibrobacteraceae bacterium]|nr:flagellar export protein FliJ [Fibrobacteraceae bacterium]